MLGGSGIPRRRSVHVLALALMPVELILNGAFRELTLAAGECRVAIFTDAVQRIFTRDRKFSFGHVDSLSVRRLSSRPHWSFSGSKLLISRLWASGFQREAAQNLARAAPVMLKSSPKKRIHSEDIPLPLGPSGQFCTSWISIRIEQPDDLVLVTLLQHMQRPRAVFAATPRNQRCNLRFHATALISAKPG